MIRLSCFARRARLCTGRSRAGLAARLFGISRVRGKVGLAIREVIRRMASFYGKGRFL
jgi:hypothetical protein